MNSPRATLLSSVEAVLTQITTAAGYLTDVGRTFTLEPAPVLGETTDACITVIWTRQERATIAALTHTHRLTTFQVIAKVPVSFSDAQARLDAITTDIETAMNAKQAHFPVGFHCPQYQVAEPLIPQQHTVGWIGVCITYTSHIPIHPPAPSSTEHQP
ncbi:hypothetical protein [Xylella fastidiosa]|uniref:DUF3168 domain-containing protein n=1 Tax=Xylella fastidiosa subsp. multiplex TaxID=644357 RepID=A0AAW6HRK0_XYLFS|nr:hypothetical protein [Xylella fastidiosa]AIC13909.1 hypothetical protein P303_07975 [Xylella fastidiosa MUL0034]MDC6407275.1 hypothetical protein [Xylella fastidiosa subsp. multiplex]MDD0927978.1 hypothetical protein [Xylella fastidiosa subsp. multiplex]MDD0936668.1 hypothetical protein [Xylella fastidiosa subsp. multiplex]RWA36881.1 hypothetical protein XfCFBP8078_10805 [Xylella fastidiosa subsp. multiplex]